MTEHVLEVFLPLWIDKYAPEREGVRYCPFLTLGLLKEKQYEQLVSSCLEPLSSPRVIYVLAH